MQSTKQKEQWFLLGDLHGDSMPILNFYLENRERLQLDSSKNYMILLGDVGANFSFSYRDEEFKEDLSTYPFTYICLRGNHEARVQNVMERDPSKWELQRKYGGVIYVEKAYPHIEYLSDVPAVYEFGGYKTLSIPGAYSIDKWYRLRHGWPWFEDELLTAAEMERGQQLIEQEASFDLVISHTCPLYYEPTDLFLAGVEQWTVDKSMEKFMEAVEEKLDYKRWAFGHFHADRLYPWNNGKQQLMLYNETVVDLNKFMVKTQADTLEDITA